MISINKLGKSLLAALLLTGAATIMSCGSDDSDDGPKLGELKAIFSSDNFSVEAGGTVSLPFTVTGVEGATLALGASASNTAAATSVTTDANYSGSVEFTAPAITDGETISVTLTVTDSKNNRSTTAQTSVTVGGFGETRRRAERRHQVDGHQTRRFVRTAFHGDGHRHGHDRF